MISCSKLPSVSSSVYFDAIVSLLPHHKAYYWYSEDIPEFSTHEES
jgi:hypothetical protein